jgi:hypothetical protein
MGSNRAVRGFKAPAARVQCREKLCCSLGPCLKKVTAADNRGLLGNRKEFHVSNSTACCCLYGVLLFHRI